MVYIETYPVIEALTLSFHMSILGSLIALCFGLAASLVLTNILIAQLNHSYEFVQEYSQLAARAQLLHSVALVEWQMRFKIWVR